MKKWEDLPAEMQNSAVAPYYEILRRRVFSLLFKRIFDFLGALILLIILSPVMLILVPYIRLNSPGPAIFTQVRVTRYGKKFKIYKFRTMRVAAAESGSQVTVNNDQRITSVGAFLRKYRLDELPQLFNILLGQMSFVGTRPEVTQFVEQYQPEMYATLLLPAGVTSRASIEYKDESRLLADAKDAQQVYIEQVLPAKMQINLEQLREFSLKKDFLCLLQTLKAVIS